MGDGREGDFDEFYRASRRRMHGYVYVLTGDVVEAQDVVQEAFVRAWQRWATVGRYPDPESWVRVVAGRIAISRWRGRRSRARAYARHGAPGARRRSDARHVALVDALRRLPASQRTTLALHYVLGTVRCRHRAARRTSPVGTVKARLSRAGPRWPRCCATTIARRRSRMADLDELAGRLDHELPALAWEEPGDAAGPGRDRRRQRSVRVFGRRRGVRWSRSAEGSRVTHGRPAPAPARAPAPSLGLAITDGRRCCYRSGRCSRPRTSVRATRHPQRGHAAQEYLLAFGAILQCPAYAGLGVTAVSLVPRSACHADRARRPAGGLRRGPPGSPSGIAPQVMNDITRVIGACARWENPDGTLDSPGAGDRTADVRRAGVRVRRRRVDALPAGLRDGRQEGRCGAAEERGGRGRGPGRRPGDRRPGGAGRPGADAPNRPARRGPDVRR